MEYLHQGTRERLVRATNNLGETPLHLAVAFAGRTGMGGRRESDSGCDKREVGIAVQVRGANGWVEGTVTRIDALSWLK